MRRIATLLRRLTLAVLLAATLARIRDALARRAARRTGRRAQGRGALPSLYERHPHATAATRRRVGLRSVPLDQIVGTLRNPSQNTRDFLPLPQLRGRNWEARWQRIRGANDRLAILPPVDLVKVGGEFWVADGHNRIAAALLAGAAEVDADVTELLLPGTSAEPSRPSATTALIETDELRHAVAGDHNAAIEHRSRADALTRSQLAELASAAEPEAAAANEGEDRPSDASQPGEPDERPA